MLSLLFNPIVHTPLKSVQAEAVGSLLASLGVPVPKPIVSMLLKTVVEERSVMEIINANGGLAKVLSAAAVLKSRPVDSISVDDLVHVLSKFARVDDAHKLGLSRLLEEAKLRAGFNETLGSFLANGKAKEFALEIASGKELEPYGLVCDFCGHSEIVTFAEGVERPTALRCPSCANIKLLPFERETT